MFHSHQHCQTHHVMQHRHSIQGGKAHARHTLDPDCRDGSECTFSNYNDLKRALLFQARHGRPDAEYTPVK